MLSSRRQWLAASVMPLRAGAAGLPLERLGVACPVGKDETSTRKVLAAARQAGFASAQIQFAWDGADRRFLEGLPAWMRAEDIRASALGAYVNCASPETVIMNCRRADFARAVDFAASFGSPRLVAWTGGFGSALMKADPRNFQREAQDSVLRFLEPFLPRLENAGLVLALETYITLVCPDAQSLGSLLARLPKCVGAVLDPPNLTPLARYADRDEVLREMAGLLRDRVALVHLKDFRLAKDGAGYELPGPLDGEMNYRLYAGLIRSLPGAPPIIAEHLQPDQFARARQRLAAIL